MDEVATRWRVAARLRAAVPPEALDRIALIVANERARRAGRWKYATG
jgi:hypothetical protein